jgi:hypothetical protein
MKYTIIILNQFNIKKKLTNIILKNITKKKTKGKNKPCREIM